MRDRRRLSAGIGPGRGAAWTGARCARWGLVLACGIAAPVLAQGADLPPAPDWFVAAVVDVTTAQQLSQSCTEVELAAEVIVETTNGILERLTEEGFDTSRPGAGMAPSPELFAARQEAFVAKHGLTSEITEGAVCAAARAEMADNSGIGRLLVEVPG